jgi:hypothetical protein
MPKGAKEKKEIKRVLLSALDDESNLSANCYLSQPFHQSAHLVSSQIAIVFIVVCDQ